MRPSRSFLFGARALSWLAVAATIVTTSLALRTATPAHADTPAISNLADGRGLTQVGKAEGTPTNFVITMTTPEVTGQRKIRIIVPDDYYTDPGKRYPVFYFLHGAGDGPGNPYNFVSIWRACR
ncbi:hypothetical protein [Streptomyces erythrochromogenes]|uniref:hypothetical protein n=1 Tax=Streptomyces erythrochromogenes TaxID=285574 RepID=UPI003702693A